MKIRHFIHSPENLLKQGQEVVKQAAEPKFLHRVTMVNLILSGMKPKDLSQYCGDSVRAINTWVKKVDEEGWESLMSVTQTSHLAESDSESRVKKGIEKQRNIAENVSVWQTRPLCGAE